MNTHYSVLGVRPSADADRIKTAFRKAAKTCHPDLHGGDPVAAWRFRQLVMANTVLRDPAKRAAYDLALRLERRQRRREWARTTLKFAAVAVVGMIGGGVLFLAGLATIVPAGKDHVAEVELVGDEVKAEPTPLLAAREVPAEEARVAPAPENTGEPVPTADEPNKASDQTAAQTAEAANVVVAPLTVHAQAADGEPPAGGASNNDPRSYREQADTACRDGDFERAVAAFDHVIAMEPGDAQAYHLRGNLKDELGDSDGALADYDQAIRLNPDSSVYRDRGILWQRMGALDQAIVDLDRAVRFTFSEPGIYIDRGFVWFQKGRHDRAAADFDRAVKIDVEFARVYIDRGVLMHSNGICNRAAGQIDRIAHIEPNILTPFLREKLPH